MQPLMISDVREHSPVPLNLDTTNLFWFFSPPEICAKNSSEPPFSMTSVLESLEELASSPCSTSSTLRFLSALTDSAIAFQIQAQYSASQGLNDDLVHQNGGLVWSTGVTKRGPRAQGLIEVQGRKFRKVRRRRGGKGKSPRTLNQGVVSLSCVPVSGVDLEGHCPGQETLCKDVIVKGR